ncbi:MAG TPA: diheme cytochrome c [Syntrophobacteria bacterium]|nr:diheme cytochrome c [Syntrophobacteria bacterium]
MEIVEPFDINNKFAYFIRENRLPNRGMAFIDKEDYLRVCLDELERLCASHGRQLVRHAIHYTALVVVCMLAFGTFYEVFAGDGYRKRNRGYQRGLHQGDNNDDRDADLKPVANQMYKDTCGVCHFAYQPELLPSASWAGILGNLPDHFGQAVDIDAGARKTIAKYLTDYAADHSGAKLAVKIMKCLRGQTPSRITQIPYIRREHREISPDVFSTKAVGSFSNCSACHRTADQGIYDDDNVVIPK